MVHRHMYGYLAIKELLRMTLKEPTMITVSWGGITLGHWRIPRFSVPLKGAHH